MRIGHFFSLLACVYLVGGHWAVLQSVAWVGMLANYGRAYGVEKAVVMTFDGAHPCAMCRGIQSKKTEEAKQNLPLEKVEKVAQKAVLPISVVRLSVPTDDVSSLSWAAYTFQWIVRNFAPPTPVPRFAVA